VDDDPAIRRLLCRTLKGAGYATLNAPTGAAALQIVEEHNPPIHLLLTDIVMPEMDGFELANKIKMEMRHPETRVLFMSGHADDRPDIRKLLEDAPHPSLLKPFTRDTLRQSVRRVLTVAMPRFVKALPVLYRAEGESEWQSGMTVNISESGLLLDAAEPVALEARLKLTFELPERLGRLNAGQVTCLGRVVRHGEPTRSTPYPLGIQFIAGSDPRAGERAQIHA
jgi:CheY-like chemotaxis protein